jgi:hypothetical protein
MAEKSGKKKTKKAAKASADPSVLGNLRSTRPSRIGAERRTATATKPRPATPKTTASKPKATAATKSAPKPAAKKRAVTTQATTAKPAAAMRPPTPPPPVSEPPRHGRPSGTEIVTTAMQAAGELAQIGLTVCRQVLKRATDRIPRP